MAGYPGQIRTVELGRNANDHKELPRLDAGVGRRAEGWRASR